VARAGEELPLVAAEPEELRPDRLRREHGAGPPENLLSPERRVELRDLGCGARVHAVEDRGAKCASRRVGRAEARPDPADADRADGVSSPRGEERPADGDKVAPPRPLGVVLGPPRPRHRQLVRDLVLGDELDRGRRQDPLRARGADVHPEQELVPHAATRSQIAGRRPRGPRTTGGMPAISATWRSGPTASPAVARMWLQGKASTDSP